MLWLKKRKGEDSALSGDTLSGTTSAAQEPRASGNGGSLDAAADTAVDFLRSFGRYAFEISGMDATTFGRQCEA